MTELAPAAAEEDVDDDDEVSRDPEAPVAVAARGTREIKGSDAAGSCARACAAS